MEHVSRFGHVGSDGHLGSAYWDINLRMFIAFFDESYPQGMAKYSVAAVVMNMESLFDLSREIRTVMAYANQAFQIPLDAELHGHEMMQGRRKWKPVAGKYRAAEKIYTMAFQAIVDSGAHVFIEGIDVERQRQRYSDPYDPHQVTLMHNLERISEYATTRDRRVLVVSDEVPNQEEHAASMAFYSVQGTPGYKSSKLTQIVHPVRFEDSKLHIGLQVADLVSYLYNRRATVVEKDDRAELAKERMWNTLVPAIHHVRMWVP